MSTCSFDYLSESFDNKFFVTVLFTFAYVIPMMMIIFYYGLICGHVFSHEKALKDQAKKMHVKSIRKSGMDNAEVRITKAAITVCFLFVLGKYSLLLEHYSVCKRNVWRFLNSFLFSNSMDTI